jgi:hypothetical protein
VSHRFVRQASPHLPRHLLPNVAFSTCYPKRLSTRSFSADQSVISRPVSDSTTSYPSMGFVPLQDTTDFLLRTSCLTCVKLPKACHISQCDRESLSSTWLGRLNLSRTVRENSRPTLTIPSILTHLKNGNPTSQFSHLSA